MTIRKKLEDLFDRVANAFADSIPGSEDFDLSDFSTSDLNNKRYCSVTKHVEFDMGHRIPNHESKCKHLHGHRFKLEVTFGGIVIEQPGAPDENMVIDFGEMKQILMKNVVNVYDHKTLIYKKDPLLEHFYSYDSFGVIVVDFIPTAEGFAEHIYNTLVRQSDGRNYTVEKVRLYETPNSYAEIER